MVFLQRPLGTRDLQSLVIECWVCWWFCSDNQPARQLPPRLCSSPQSHCNSELCCAEPGWHRYYPCWCLAACLHACTSCPWVWAGMCPCWSLLRFPKVVFLLGPMLALNCVITAIWCLGFFFVYLVSNMFLQLQHSGDFSVTSLSWFWEAELLNAGSSLGFDTESFPTGWLHGCKLAATLGNSQVLCKTSSF